MVAMILTCGHVSGSNLINYLVRCTREALPVARTRMSSQKAPKQQEMENMVEMEKEETESSTSEHPDACSSTTNFACLSPSVQLEIIHERDGMDPFSSQSSFSSTQNMACMPPSIQLEIMQDISQRMQSAPSISHGIDDEVPEDGPRSLESSDHWMLVSDVTTKTKEVVDLGKYCYFALQYWHTNSRYPYRNRAPFDIGRLRSACWLVVRLDRAQLVHGNLGRAPMLAW